MTDLQLVTFIFSALAVLVLGAWLWHNRAARGNAQVARYQAEIKLEREDRSAWLSAVHALRTDLDARLQLVEERMRHVPTRTDFAELEGTVGKVQAQYEATAERQSEIRNSLRRIEDYLLNGKRP